MHTTGTTFPMWYIEEAISQSSRRITTMKMESLVAYNEWYIFPASKHFYINPPPSLSLCSYCFLFVLPPYIFQARQTESHMMPLK